MYRKKGRGWTKHIDFMLIDIACIVIAFFISYVIRFGFNNPYMDKDYRILGVAFLLIDFFVEIMADSFKNVLKRGYLDELISTCKHAMLVFLATALFLFTTHIEKEGQKIKLKILEQNIEIDKKNEISKKGRKQLEEWFSMPYVFTYDLSRQGYNEMIQKLDEHSNNRKDALNKCYNQIRTNYFKKHKNCYCS